VTWNERGTMPGYSLMSGARAGSGFTRPVQDHRPQC